MLHTAIAFSVFLRLAISGRPLYLSINKFSLSFLVQMKALEPGRMAWEKKICHVRLVTLSTFFLFFEYVAFSGRLCAHAWTSRGDACNDRARYVQKSRWLIEGLLRMIFKHLPSFVKRGESNFQLALMIYCEFQAACCATFRSRVLSSLYYRSTVFPDQAQKV